MGITPLPFKPIPAPPRRQHLGLSLIVLGLCLLVLGLVAPAAATVIFDMGNDEMLIIVIAIPFIVGIYGGAQLIGWGRRLRAIPAEQQLVSDPRSPVLFLRSFEDDDLLDPTPRMIPLGDMFPRRYEESLAKPLNKIGPMISIGRPGNKLSILGGHRLFVSDQDWKEAVEHLRKHSAAVVLMVGRTEGLWWEIESSLKSVPHERLLFFFPFVEEPKRRQSIMQRFFGFRPAQIPLSKRAYIRMEEERQARYQLFRKKTQPLLEAELPEELGSSQFIDIDTTGKIRVLQAFRPWWYPLTIATPSVGKMM